MTVTILNITERLAILSKVTTQKVIERLRDRSYLQGDCDTNATLELFVSLTCSTHNTAVPVTLQTSTTEGSLTETTM